MMVDGIASSAFVDNWTCGKSRSLSGPVNWWEMEKSGATRRDAALLFPKSRRRRRLLRSQLLLVPSPPSFFFLPYFFLPGMTRLSFDSPCHVHADNAMTCVQDSTVTDRAGRAK